mgnify:CR=1 FL=1
MTAEGSTWQWPNGARAAVSLGYDDGNPDNLDQAMPDLEAAGFRGTFYLHLERGDVRARTADWRAAHARGHEIGNHTWYHNARTDLYGVRHGWVTKPLEEYTQADMTAEINRAGDWLDEHIGRDPDRSFTYPCGHLTLGVPPSRAAYAAAVARLDFKPHGRGADLAEKLRSRRDDFVRRLIWNQAHGDFRAGPRGDDGLASLTLVTAREPVDFERRSDAPLFHWRVALLPAQIFNPQKLDVILPIERLLFEQAPLSLRKFENVRIEARDANLPVFVADLSEHLCEGEGRVIHAAEIGRAHV